MLGKIFQVQGIFIRASDEYEKALQYEADSFDEEIDGLCHAGSALRRQLKHELAVPYFCKALRLATERDNHTRDDLPYYELGYVFFKEGLVDIAIKAFDLSFNIGKKNAKTLLTNTGDQKKYFRKLGYAQMAMGVKSHLLGKCHRFDEALPVALSSLDVFRRAGQAQWERNIYIHIFYIYAEKYLANKDEKAFDNAEQYFNKARDAENNSSRSVATSIASFQNNALRSLYLKDYSKSIDFSLKAVEISELAESQDGTAEILHVLGRAYLAQGEYAKAIEAFYDAIRSEPDRLNRWGIARALRDLAQAQYESGEDLVQAIQNIETARRLFEALGSVETLSCEPLSDTLKQTLRGKYDRYQEHLLLLEKVGPGEGNFLKLRDNSDCTPLFNKLTESR